TAQAPTPGAPQDGAAPPSAAPGKGPRTQWELLAQLREWGFAVNAENTRCETIEEAVACCLAWEQRRARLPYDIDGVVVKVDDLDLQAELGAVGREPRWAIAYKFPPAQATTRLRRIGINVGRTGSLTPFAILDPVQVGGVTIRLAVLHNEDDIRRKDIREGDTVLVQRAGEVRPYVVGPILSQRPAGTRQFELPRHCPVCGAPVSRGVDDGEAVARCTNTFAGCPKQLRERILHFCSRPAMDVQAVGEQLIDAMVTQRLVQDPADLYSLTKAQLMGLERMGERSAQHVLDNLARSKSRPFERVLFALGIRHVGARVAEILARAFGGLEALRQASLEEIVAVEGVGRKIAESVHAALRDPLVLAMVDKLARAGVSMTVERPAAHGPLAGQTFVVTGRLQGYSRAQIEQRIRALGGLVEDAVTRRTSYLVVGDEPGSKLTRARQLGTPILDEATFEHVVGPAEGTG
ncbi:MAG TPA: NAD-dependent DNA ligase LigA, partial [Chloroflexota bacterium]|nr:NAD-dependent DNA ligase LigA [Chloroflexota bacterium]